MVAEELIRTAVDPLAGAEEQTPPEPVTESTSEAEAVPVEDNFDGVLKELGFAEDVEAGAGDGAEASQEANRTYTKEEFDTALKEERSKEKKRELRDSEVATLRNKLRTRKAAIEQHLQGRGVAQGDIAPILTEVDLHHDDAQKVARADALFEAESNLWTSLYTLLPEAEQKAFADRRVERHAKGEENLTAITKDFNDTVKSVATKGRFTQTQVNEAKREAAREVIKKLVAAGVKVPGYNAPEVGGATGTSNGSTPTMAQWNALTSEQRLLRVREDPDIEARIMSRP